MRLVIVILLLCIAGCATTEPWTRDNKAAAGFFVMGKLADTASTIDFLKNTNARELNPILGERPSNEEVISYMIITGIAQLIIADLLPPKWRERWLIVFGSVNTYCAIHNSRLK